MYKLCYDRGPYNGNDGPAGTSANERGDPLKVRQGLQKSSDDTITTVIRGLAGAFLFGQYV